MYKIMHQNKTYTITKYARNTFFFIVPLSADANLCKCAIQMSFILLILLNICILD